ncbi:TBC1 domain family member 23-like [Hylaeus volcanicus]|uniref:TBC1 domain family member 23-like n=1 Tax=Hylaeus volcanicus TaxID=313075 RepID=UPI0023B7B1A2|nr:TBC1 domain family member 23-like [Hylaeus volcanicus]
MNQNQHEPSESQKEKQEQGQNNFTNVCKAFKEETKQQLYEEDAYVYQKGENEAVGKCISTQSFSNNVSNDFLKTTNSCSSIETHIEINDSNGDTLVKENSNSPLTKEKNEWQSWKNDLPLEKDSSLLGFKKCFTDSMTSKEMHRSFSLFHLRHKVQTDIFSRLENLSSPVLTKVSTYDENSIAQIFNFENDCKKNFFLYIYFDNQDPLEKEYFRGDVWSRLLWVTEDYVHRIQQESFNSKTLSENEEKLLCKDIHKIFPNIPFLALKKTQECMKYSLQYICTKYDIKYTCNMAIVFAPFLFLTSASLSLPTAIACFVQFMTQYLPLLKNHDPLVLTSVFDTFLVLLKYHDPKLCNFLVKHSIKLEPYFKAWFLTLFASKQNLLVLVLLWDYYIAVNNRFLCYFLSIALLFLYREVLFSCDLSKLQEKTLSLNITDLQTLSQVLKLSDVIKKRTPLSFFLIRSFFKPCKKTSWLMLTREKDVVKRFQMFYVTGNEIFRNLYKACHNDQVESNTLLLYLIDIRNEKTFHKERFPCTVLINISKEGWRSDILNLLAFPLSNKDATQLCTFKNLHICLIGHKDSTFNDKILRLVFSFLVDQCFFPYISVLYGGFKALYEAAKRFEKNLEYHDKITCQACRSLFSFNSSTTLDETSSASFKKNFSNTFQLQRFLLTKKSINAVSSKDHLVTDISLESCVPQTDNVVVKNNPLPSYQYIKFARDGLNSNSITNFNKDKISRLFKSRKHVIFKTFSCAPYFFNDNFQYSHFKLTDSVNNWCKKQVSYIPLTTFEETKICVFLCFIKLISIPDTGGVELVSKKNPAFYVPTQALCQFVLTSTDIVIVSRLFDPSVQSKTLTHEFNKSLQKNPLTRVTQPFNTHQKSDATTTDFEEPFVIQYYKIPHQFVVYLIELQKNSGSCLLCSDFNLKKEYDLCVVTFLNNQLPAYIAKRLQELLATKAKEKMH